MKFDLKFSLSQMFANSDGKTSASGVMGSIMCAASAIGFLMGAFTRDANTLINSVAYGTLGAALLGYRKSKVLPDGATEQPAQEPQQAENPA